jgi:hypothetical protein
MSKKPLIETNPYLKDAARYRRDLITAVSTSTAIETGARAGTIAKSLPSVPGPMSVKSPRRSAR